MKKHIIKFTSAITISFFCVNSLAQSLATDLNVSSPVAAVPPNIVSTSNKPMVMLASSKDHTLFGPIYTDYEDIDNDGIIDTTFKPTFKYYGYFDSTKCYSYNSSQFEPTQKSIIVSKRYTCPQDKNLWSGNFLNWATMTRMDVVRKMLYGGKRHTDIAKDGKQNSLTVLERANLSQDAHSFVKHYWGNDIRDYTPFSTEYLTKKTGSNQNTYSGLTICNRSSEMGEGGTPVIRLARGNYRMWATVDGTVCTWNGNNFGNKLSRYFIDSDKGNGLIAHEKESPKEDTDGAKYSNIGPNLNVRVKVCDSALIGEERCQAYPANSTENFKPIGIFQEFGLGTSEGNAARAEFGILTGSYDSNLSRGALRKNMGDFSDEINLSSGVFCHSTNSGCSATINNRSTGNGAIKSLDGFVLYGRTSSGGYTDSNNQLPSELIDGKLSAWGNPMGEMLVQALNYFSGKSSTNPASEKDSSKNIPTISWTDPFSASVDSTRLAKYGNPICRPMYNIAFSSSALSFDGDSSSDFSRLENRSGDLASYVNKIGEAEKIHGTDRSVGNVDGGWGDTCAKKTVTSLYNVTGICPEAPAIGGTYHAAGAALYANTSKIRNVTNPPSDLNKIKDALKVKTMTASLAGGVARIEVPIPGSNPKKYVYITPESLWNSGGTKTMPGAMLTFQSINSGERYGTFVVTWNDALLGGDYDMDIAGFIRYDITDDPGSPSKYSIEVKTDIINVGAGYTGTHGFSIIGSDNDGRYLTHRHNRSENMLKGQTGYLCDGLDTAVNPKTRCNVSTSDTQVSDNDYLHPLKFKMLGVSDVILEDPLWYAAKYGYFNSSKIKSDGTYENIYLPSNKSDWDNLKSDGSIGSDGIPDGYFLARRPDILEMQLRRVLDAATSTSNASAPMSRPVLTIGAFKYTPKFDSSTISGEIEANKLQADGTFSTTATWEAGRKLHTQHAYTQGSTRQIITNTAAGIGIPFRWENLDKPFKDQLTIQSTNKLTEGNAQTTLNYIRGDTRKEGINGLRLRENNLLGPIINSTPWLQQRPLATWGSVSGYNIFYNLNKNRKNLLWVGANDGMLHAFDSLDGSEVFAYVPGSLANRLAEIPLQRSTDAITMIDGTPFVTGAQVQPTGSVWAYVDGNPYTADIKIGDEWKTYLFSALGRGGRGIFALDATNIDQLKENNASTVFKWQFTAKDDSDFGYQTNDVIIHNSSNQASTVARLNNGKFALILGNGPKSLNGKAALFIIYIDGPESGNWNGKYRKIILDNTNNNGLSAPRWEDTNGDGTADVVYAGDLKGNLWKIDISNIDDTQWKPAFSAAAESNALATPLFKATYSKTDSGKTVTTGLPITTAPQIIYMAKGGAMVNFATGNAFENGDFGNNSVRQAMFGVWDRGAALPNARMVQRTAIRHADGIVTATGSKIDWTLHDGWSMHLPSSGEAVLSDPLYDAGVLIFVSTRPKTATNECSEMPSTSMYALDPISGLPSRSSLGTVTIDGVVLNIAAIPITDPKLGGPYKNNMLPPKVGCTAGDPGCVCNGDQCQKEMPVCAPGQRSVNVIGRTTNVPICYSNAPRIQWREIPGLRTFQ